MKFANIIHNGLSRSNNDRIVNLGDAFELIAIDQLYQIEGIKETDIVNIDLYELESYAGEEVILPINFMIMPQIMDVNLLNMSPKIIPVFLGVSFTQTDFSKQQIDFLKKWQPIGCRDERTKEALTSLGITAYIGGCLVTTIFREKSNNKRNKVAFIDVPKGVYPFIPSVIKDDIIILEHEFMISYDELIKDPSLKKYAAERIDYYNRNIGLIVTSRFHGAVIALALGIPVILVAENNFYKFSWLSKILPFYDTEHYSEINWFPEYVDVRELKKQMIQIAVTRIRYAYAVNKSIWDIDKKLSNEHRDNSPSLRYAESAINYVKHNWNKQNVMKYALWGVNENAYYIYRYINMNYKKAKLVKVYDGLRKVEFNGLQSEWPNEDSIDADCFVFVTSNTAKKVAKQLFERMKKENYFCCELEFITKIE